MQVDQTASADNLMVSLTLLSQAEVFFPATTYTASERRRC